VKPNLESTNRRLEDFTDVRKRMERIVLWHFRFSRRRVWRWLSSGMLCRVVWKIFTDVSEVLCCHHQGDEPCRSISTRLQDATSQKAVNLAKKKKPWWEEIERNCSANSSVQTGLQLILIYWKDLPWMVHVFRDYPVTKESEDSRFTIEFSQLSSLSQTCFCVPKTSLFLLCMLPYRPLIPLLN
jgi:hypothetical protein